MTDADERILEAHVREAHATQENGRSTFEGLDTHAWHGIMQRYHRLALKDAGHADVYTLYAEESALISATLQVLDTEVSMKNPFYDLP